MLVIHPYDKSTKLAGAIYANMDVRVADATWYERGIGPLLWQTPKEEPILMIGYGDCHGLYDHRYSEVIDLNPMMVEKDPNWRERVEACVDTPHYVIRNLHAYNLRKHNGNLIGIWPGAVEFARRNRLHGLFTDKFYFNHKDAEEYGFVTLFSYIDEINYSLYRTLGKLISHHVPFYKIPQELKDRAANRQEIFHRNFESFFCF